MALTNQHAGYYYMIKNIEIMKETEIMIMLSKATDYE